MVTILRATQTTDNRHNAFQPITWYLLLVQVRGHPHQNGVGENKEIKFLKLTYVMHT